MASREVRWLNRGFTTVRLRPINLFVETALKNLAWETFKTLGVYVLIMSPLALWIWRLHAERRKHLGGREEPFTQYWLRSVRVDSPPGKARRILFDYEFAWEDEPDE